MHPGWLCGAAMVLVAAACGRPAPRAAVSSPPSAAPPTAAAPPQAVPAVEGGAETVHTHQAPHGGTLVELGDEFAHIELVLDSTAGTLAAYSLDGEAERAVRLNQPDLQIRSVRPGELPREIALSAVANALTGETATNTSRYRAIVRTLKGVTAFEGSIERVLEHGTAFEDVVFRYPSDGHE